MPVCDFEAELRERIAAVVDVLEELTTVFNILIVDYGSTDESRDVAWQLRRELPQVDVLELTDGRFYDAVELGLGRATGDVVFVHDPAFPLGASAMGHLWAMRNDDDLVMAQSGSSDVKPSVLPTYSATQSPLSKLRNASSVQIIRRSAVSHRLPQRESATSAEDRVFRTDTAESAHAVSQPSVKRLPNLLTRLKRLANAETVRRR